jgi:hypothetical protein
MNKRFLDCPLNGFQKKINTSISLIYSSANNAKYECKCENKITFTFQVPIVA